MCLHIPSSLISAHEIVLNRSSPFLGRASTAGKCPAGNMPTGLEETAAVVALVSLAFQCLNGCIVGYRLLNTALHLGEHAAHFHCALLLEENRLLLWAKRSGLTNERLDKRLNVKLVYEILGNLENLLCDTEKLRSRYKFDIKFKDSPQSNTWLSKFDPMSSADFAFLAQDDVRQEREQVVTRGGALQKKAPYYKQFWFAAVDKTRFNELIHEINYLITGLQELLDNVKQAQMEADIQFQRLQSINLAVKLTDIQSLIEGLTISEAEETDLANLKRIRIKDKAADDPRADPGWSSGLRDLLQQKDSAIQSTLEPISTDAFDDSKPAEPVGNSGLHAVQYYDRRRVYVELKSYEWAAGHDEIKEKAKRKIASLALLLNAPKMSKFRTLHCAGLVEDIKSQRYQFVYNWPLNCDPTVVPRSLKDYLNSAMMPTLTDRLQLARELVTSVFLFHTSDWLHKNICSDNVLFFSTDAAPPSTVHNPFLVGFEYSRPDTKDSWPYDDDPEFDIYRHPIYLGIRQLGFRKAYDVYSLGLVLMEIAKWRPLKYIYTRFAWENYIALAKATRKNPKDVVREKRHHSKEEIQNLESQFMIESDLHATYMREQLLDNKEHGDGAADIAFRAGSILKDVILFCLGKELDNLEDAQALQTAYYENVVRPFEICRV